MLRQRCSDQALYWRWAITPWRVFSETRAPNKHQPSFPTSASSCTLGTVCPHTADSDARDDSEWILGARSRGFGKEWAKRALTDGGFFGFIVCPGHFALGGFGQSHFVARTSLHAFQNSLGFVAVIVVFS